MLTAIWHKSKMHFKCVFLSLSLTFAMWIKSQIFKELKKLFFSFLSFLFKVFNFLSHFFFFSFAAGAQVNLECKPRFLYDERSAVNEEVKKNENWSIRMFMYRKAPFRFFWEAKAFRYMAYIFIAFLNFVVEQFSLSLFPLFLSYIMQKECAFYLLTLQHLHVNFIGFMLSSNTWHLSLFL